MSCSEVSVSMIMCAGFFAKWLSLGSLARTLMIFRFIILADPHLTSHRAPLHDGLQEKDIYYTDAYQRCEASSSSIVGW
jgi:hypothetical protein